MGFACGYLLFIYVFGMLGAVNPPDPKFLVNAVMPAAALSMRPSGVPDGRRVASSGFGWGVVIS